jgi:Xaa-Pro dipeptidase
MASEARLWRGLFSNRMDLDRIQEALRRDKLDGWLFFDHHQRDPLAYRILGFRPQRHVTRRWYYLIPAQGEPRGIVHNVEPGMLDDLPGDKFHYSRWQEAHGLLAKLLSGSRRIAMQYSPDCAIPYVAMVDAGTIELVRKQGVEVISSAELIQLFEAALTPEQYEAHIEAGKRVDRVRGEAFRLIGEKLAGGIDEITVRDWILNEFRGAGLVTDSGPIVAVNAHAGNPHYEPSPETNAVIRRGDFVLLDMWARLDKADAIFYDITWNGFCGDPSPRVLQVFEIVRDARDQAILAVQKATESGLEIHGYQVDDAARGYIESRGYGERFVHRTGHSIGTEVHGTGANMDNFETRDERRIVPSALFSIEPGVYLEDFGVRCEVDVFVNQTAAVTTGEVQRELVRIG